MRKLVTDLTEIKRLADRKRKKNFEFRSKLKMEVYDEESLDVTVHALYKEVSAQVDCRACGNCCKAFDIIMNDDDISKLSKAVGMATEVFKSHYLKKAEDQAGLCFKAKPCPFLKKNQCTHYDARPEVCSGFPYLDLPEFLGRTCSLIDRSGTCPIVFNVWERLKLEFKFL